MRADERQHARRLSLWRTAMAVAWHRGEDACSGLYLPLWRRSATDAVLGMPEERRSFLTAVAGQRRPVLVGTPLEVQMRAVLEPVAGAWWRELAEHAVPTQPLPDRDVLRAALVATDADWKRTVEYRALYEHLSGFGEYSLTDWPAES